MVNNDEARRRLLEEVIAVVNKHMTGTIHGVDGLPMASVIIEDGTYRTKPLDADMELIYTNAYVGRSGKIIFQFEPVDKSPYKTVEFPPDKLDRALPFFATELREALTYGDEKLTVLLDQVARKIVDGRREEEKQEQEQAAVAYENNPLFGRFG